jgi:hypothetical protein
LGRSDHQSEPKRDGYNPTLLGHFSWKHFNA